MREREVKSIEFKRVFNVRSVNPTCHEPLHCRLSCKIEQVLNGKTQSRTRFDPKVGLISGSLAVNVVGIRRYPDVRGKSERER